MPTNQASIAGGARTEKSPPAALNNLKSWPQPGAKPGLPSIGRRCCRF